MADTFLYNLDRALARREPLAADPLTTAYRLLNGAGDGLPGLTAERYGPLLLASRYEGQADEAALERLVDGLDRRLGMPVFVRRRPKQASGLGAAELALRAPAAPVRGMAAAAAEVLENGLRFLVRMDEGLSTGLFLDMRDLRRAMAGWATGTTVLNTFAYTCAFGVAALSGGATRVLNLDAARPALAWGQANYERNALPADPYDFVVGDAFDWLRRLRRRGEQFGVVVLDPPSYSTTRRTRWVLERDYDALAAAATHVVAPGGLLLACANHGGVKGRRFRELAEQGVAQAGRRAELIGSYGPSPLDFPPPAGQEPALKVLALRIAHRRV